MQILLCDQSSWMKPDPTEFNADSNTIRVRSDYDIESDPCGWIVHECIHAFLHDAGFVDDYNPPLIQYPNNAVERMAYTWQFVYQLESHLIHSLSDIKSLMPWKFERYGEEWAKQYFKDAQERISSCDSSLIITGGRLNRRFDLQFEDAFRILVEEAKAKRKACIEKESPLNH